MSDFHLRADCRYIQNLWAKKLVKVHYFKIWWPVSEEMVEKAYLKKVGSDTEKTGQKTIIFTVSLLFLWLSFFFFIKCLYWKSFHFHCIAMFLQVHIVLSVTVHLKLVLLLLDMIHFHFHKFKYFPPSLPPNATTSDLWKDCINVPVLVHILPYFLVSCLPSWL